MRASNLNAGLGLDWAGHVRAIDSWLTAKICSIATEENLGTLLPMGSGIILQLENVTLHCIIAWMHFCWLVIYYSFLSETSSLFWLIIVDSQCGYSHLNDGTGELWAGQTKLKEELWSALKDPKVSELVENLGDDVPTGSGSISLKICFLMNWDRLWAVNVCVGVGELYFCYPSINGEFFSEVF